MNRIRAWFFNFLYLFFNRTYWIHRIGWLISIGPSWRLDNNTSRDHATGISIFQGSVVNLALNHPILLCYSFLFCLFLTRTVHLVLLYQRVTEGYWVSSWWSPICTIWTKIWTWVGCFYGVFNYRILSSYNYFPSV